MPYIITRPVIITRESRIAVATLEEARGKVWDLGAYATPDLAAQTYFDKDGGTIGPLPDGTIIEIERVSEDDLVRRLNTLGYPHALGHNPVGVIAAYNAAQ